MLWFTWLLSLVLKFVVIHCDTQKQRQIEFIPRINWTTTKNTKYKKRDKNIGKEWNWITTYNYIAINPSSQIKKYFNRILTFGCMKIGTNKTKQNKTIKRQYDIPMVHVQFAFSRHHWNKIFKGRQPFGYTRWKTDLTFFSKIVVHTRHGSDLT